MKIDLVLDSITDKRVKKFFKYILAELEKHDITLHLDANLSQVGAKRIGYYCNYNKEIRCYVNLDDLTYLGTIAHEFSHSSQASEQTKEWEDYESLELTMEDIQIKKKLPPTLHKFRRTVIALEWDAERRAIELIKKFRLPLDLNHYIQEANLVLYKYVYLCHRHTFPTLKYKDQEQIMRGLPTYLLDKEMFVWSKMPPLLKVKLDELRIK